MRVASNISDRDEQRLEELKSDSIVVAETFIGKGYPDGWNSANVQKLGLTDGSYIVNDTKVFEASRINYTGLKVFLGTRNEFFAFFQDKDGNIVNSGACGIGKLSVSNITSYICSNFSVQASMLARSERLVYRNGTLKMIVYAWRT